MSAILIVLMSAFTSFGVTLLDPEPDVEEPDPEAVPSEEGLETGEDLIAAALSEEDPPEEPSESAPGDSGDSGDSGDGGGAPTGVIVVGTAADNDIETEDGNDIIDARGGNDTVQAGGGEDTIRGEEGDDILYGASDDLSDDDARDVLDGGRGEDTLYMGDTDEATGGDGADTFVRLADVSSQVLIQDFETANDVIVVQHDGGAAPTITEQRVATDGLIIELSDGTEVQLIGLTAPIDPALLTFVDTGTP